MKKRKKNERGSDFNDYGGGHVGRRVGWWVPGIKKKSESADSFHFQPTVLLIDRPLRVKTQHDRRSS